MIGRVLINVRVAHLFAGPYDKRRAELVRTLPGLADPVAVPMGAPSPAEAPRIEEEPERVHSWDGCRAGGRGIVVDENGERDAIVLHEVGCISLVPGAHRDDLGPEPLDLFVVLTQLRGVLPAEQSAEVAEKDQHDRPVLPVSPEPMRLSGGVVQLDRGQRREIHPPTVGQSARHRGRVGAAGAPGCETGPMTTTFTRMDESTAEQWSAIGKETMEHQDRVADSVLSMLASLADVTDGFAVDQLTHCLQTATLAERAGADDEMIIASLCHDIGKAVSVPNHPKIAAAILQSYVREDVYQVVLVHQDFQGRHYYHHFGGDPDAREQYRDAPWFSLAEQFADEWDQIAFDPDYDTLPLEHFEARLRTVFASPNSF